MSAKTAPLPSISVTRRRCVAALTFAPLAARGAVPLAILGTSVAACDPLPDTRADTAPAWADLPGWQTEQIRGLVPALMRACYPSGARPGAAKLGATPPVWGNGQALDEATARTWLCRAFRPAPGQKMLFTGYFTITLSGARVGSAEFPVPILRRPPDAAQFDRAAILAGALAGRGLEIAWLRHPADLYFLQLQGSGQITFETGEVLTVVSAGDNGRAPISLERLFRGAGIADGDLSIPNLQAWAAANPAATRARFAIDPSFVFFRTGTATGACGAPLIPMRSLAVDPGFVPLGRPVWVRAGGLRRMMIAGDTGAPIRGAHRADVYFGTGPAAEAEGGRLYESGIAWQLVPTGWLG